ncbi:hypothetical protein TSAR_014477 [Trichomalopsis sarcophagae]|uniref:Uncharacterized protein n=1 Tax=Trichomalopsis sarcophagae TaxID=543379 RepID=A0A232EK13_9HYME|nr:hypothetical protein TSAR_014477 [Trichomalopsis sarcophagae]
MSAGSQGCLVARLAKRKTVAHAGQQGICLVTLRRINCLVDIFSLREYLEYALFGVQLCPTRWTNVYNLENQPMISMNSKIVTNLSITLYPDVQYSSNRLSSDNSHRIQSQEPKTKHQRFKLMKELTGSLANLGSMVTKERFRQRADLITTIIDAWSQDKDIELDQLIVTSLSNLSIYEKNTLDEDEVIDLSSITMPTPLEIRGTPKNVFKNILAKVIVAGTTVLTNASQVQKMSCIEILRS